MYRIAAFLLLAFSMPALCQSDRAKTIGDSSESQQWYITDTGLQVVDDNGADGMVYIEGFWQATSSIKDKQLIEPIAVKIWCNKPANICREVDATVTMGILRPDLTDYAISTWNNEQVIAEDSNEGKCKISHRLVVDFKSQTVTLTDFPSQVDTDQCRLFRDANSYALHSGQVMLYPKPIRPKK